MITSKIGKALREAPLEAARFARGRYPSFVSARRPAPLDQEVPVFMFHDVEPKRFEAQLCYLRDNGYSTLAMPEFMAFLKGELRLRSPSVLLTFDDGHKSWHETAFPLLRKHCFHAVGFLVTSFIREQAEEAERWLSWPEIREIEKSGVMEFESHTAFHDRIFVGPELIDFFHPGCFADNLGMDAPWADYEGEYTNRLKPGAPIYEYAPRMAGRLRFVDEPGPREACVKWVEDHGKAVFFKRRGWRGELREAHEDALSSTRAKPRFESADEQRAAIQNNLLSAKRVLEENLQKEITHLCYPWGIGSELSLAISREAGYQSNFLVAGPRNSNSPGDSPFHVPRLKDDYIFRLPGEGRQSLASVALHKLRRRAENVSIY